ncbi:MAG: hypothetical protein E7588_03885 [Ruminococcaceae bacterium]|nr:hypothetical protein [Oscillospiraceae bacterium]
MKKLIYLFVTMCILLTITGCAKTKTLHCDYCNKDVKVKESSNMEENWIIYCSECNNELFGDHPLLGNN